MTMSEQIPDESLFVRCGLLLMSDPNRLRESSTWHEGFFGFSVQCRYGVTLEELAKWCPNKKISVSIVGEIRKLGYDVVRTIGKGHHATVAVDPAWTIKETQELIRRFHEEPNPSPRTAR